MKLKIMIIIGVLLLSGFFAPLAAHWYISSIDELNQTHQEIMERQK